MKQRNKEGPGPVRGLARRIASQVRQWRQRSLYKQVLHGAAYGVGSGAVSLILVWVESRF